MIPEKVQKQILHQCKEKCTLTLVENNNIVGKLEFDSEGMSKTVEQQFSLIGYLERLYKYSKANVQVNINDIPLDKLPEIETLELEYATE
jgi:hypothetical protein